MFLFLQEVYVENYYHINWPVYCTYQNCNFSGERINELIWIGIESEEYICKIKFTSKGFFWENTVELSWDTHILSLCIECVTERERESERVVRY